MYSQILYFIVALLIFTVQQPGSQAMHTAAQTLFLSLGTFLVFVLVCRAAIRRLADSMDRGLSDAVLSTRYQRLQTRLSILALGTLAVYVYVFNIKFYLQAIPGFKQSLTMAGVAGLGLYLIHLAVVWYWCYPLYKKLHRSSISRPAFIRGQVAFASAILIPWLLISLVSDLLQAVRAPAFLNTDLGQFLLLGVVLALFVLFAPWLIVRLWGCKTLPGNQIRTELESFIGRWHFSVGDFKQWPLFGGEMLTAGVIGILPRLRYILITNGLMNLLDIDELKAVVAHEMGHVRRYHLFFYLLFFLSYAVLTYALNDLILLFLLKNNTLLQWALTPDTLHLTLFSLVYTLPIILILIIYFRYLFGFFLRNSERQADLYALGLIGHPFTLISSLEKIAIYSGHIEDLPSWHHFSIRQRVEFLLASYRNPRVARRHHLKLYGAALLFLAGIAAVSVAGFRSQSSQMVHHWRIEMQINLVEHALQEQPDDPQLYATYGGLLLEAKKYAEAEKAFKRVLSMNPLDATSLNNLAWLYATSPPPYFRPRKSLELAKEAAALDSKPYVLDTLAEAYFVNGHFREALTTIRKALLMHPDNKDYLLKQEKKFEAAIRNLENNPSAAGGGI
jgi:Zn-dependent protease with chaperone function